MVITKRWIRAEKTHYLLPMGHIVNLINISQLKKKTHLHNLLIKQTGRLILLPFIQTNLNSIYPRSLVVIGPVVLEKMKMWKVYRQTDGQWCTGK